MQKSGYCRANKMYVASPDHTVHFEGDELEAGQVYCYPIYWPSTETTNLVNRFKEIAAELDTAVQGMGASERIQHMHDHVLTQPMKSYMQTYPPLCCGHRLSCEPSEGPASPVAPRAFADARWCPGVARP